MKFGSWWHHKVNNIPKVRLATDSSFNNDYCLPIAGYFLAQWFGNMSHIITLTPVSPYINNHCFVTVSLNSSVNFQLLKYLAISLKVVAQQPLITQSKTLKLIFFMVCSYHPCLEPVCSCVNSTRHKSKCMKFCIIKTKSIFYLYINLY